MGAVPAHVDQHAQVMNGSAGRDGRRLYPLVDLLEQQIDRLAVVEVPEAMAKHHVLLPFAFEDEVLVVAFADTSDVQAIDDVRTVTGRELRVVSADAAAIKDVLARMDSLERLSESLIAETGIDLADEQPAGLDSSADAPIVRAIDRIIRRAIRQRASDVHIEPKEHVVRVRLRVDGVLTEAMRLPRQLHANVLSRLKIMASLDIALKRVPQDGRMTVRIDQSDVDVRVATIPSVWGEEIILRVLDDANALPHLEDLGLRESDLRRYERAFRKPHGAVLVVGPTGSGKSTTLYSTLAVLDEVGRKIITVEDPVEYRLPGLTQIQIDPGSGMTFARGLRSILRSDPDIVMVGEIRDGETAKVAIEASLAGHRMLSTLHTYDAAAAITRLVDMGVEPYLVASAVRCVVSQRLIRRLCERCKQPQPITAQTSSACGFGDAPMVVYAPKGCTRCDDTGYRGRVGIFEIIEVSETLSQMIGECRRTEEIAAQARREGTISLREDGMEKVREGITSMEEVLRALEGAQEH